MGAARTNPIKGGGGDRAAALTPLGGGVRIAAEGRGLAGRLRSVPAAARKSGSALEAVPGLSQERATEARKAEGERNGNERRSAERDPPADPSRKGHGKVSAASAVIADPRPPLRRETAPRRERTAAHRPLSFSDRPQPPRRRAAAPR